MYNELAKEIHEQAIRAGWWDAEPTFAEIIALCHSELSEALEEYRIGKNNIYYQSYTPEHCNGQYVPNYCDNNCIGIAQCAFNSRVPKGIAVELGDCVMRILDYCAHEKVSVAAWPIDKPKISKMPLPQLIVSCHRDLSAAYDSPGDYSYFEQCACEISSWLAEQRVILLEIIKLKHEYNKTRPYKHGGKSI